MRALAFVVVALALAISLAPAAAGGVLERGRDEHGRLLWERGVEAANSAVGYITHYTYARDAAKGGGPAPIPGNDCAATAYRLSGFRWTAPYAAAASAYAAELDASGRTWDDATGAGIFGGVTAGSAATAGVFDGVNQMDWTSLGATTTIAVTTTWYYRGSGVAVESDAQYNTHYAWSTTGDPSAMDVANIATHEIGHTFGLNHPSGKGAGCLTMYAYASEGETAKRTLGSGDVHGIRAVYGT